MERGCNRPRVGFNTKNTHTHMYTTTSHTRKNKSSGPVTPLRKTERQINQSLERKKKEWHAGD